MDLATSPWMVRSLGEPVSCVVVGDNHEIFAGGWHGRLTAWDGDGRHQWSTQTNDRVSSMAITTDRIFVANGLHLSALDRYTGANLWSIALEGSADEVLWWQDGVLATSSVYDIEHNDFIESALWKFTPEGEQIWLERFDERPWRMVLVDNKVFVGLGRPRCGLLQLQSITSFQHLESPSHSPITCGANAGTVALFGQTDGTVFSSEGKVLSVEKAAIEHLTKMVKGYIATTDEGHAVGRNEEGVHCWESFGPPVTAQIQAFEDEQTATIWLARSQGVEGHVEVWATNRKEKLAVGNFGRVHSMHGTPQRAVLGCENGDVMVWDKDMLFRRINRQEPTPSENIDDRASLLQAKLRALRQG